MPLTPEALAELQDAVGRDFVSDDPNVCLPHAWNSIGGEPGLNKLSVHVPVAIVMPDSSEQIRKVVLACNRHRLRFRAFSTGWYALQARENSVYIDLQRMNRIIKIDAENQMAVIEPGVTAGQLQAEAMKQGLTAHVVGAGPTHSPLASAAAMMGIGVSGGSTGNNARNLLSFEWVTPEGELRRIGSSASGERWFASDGPGPGWRGMIRGIMGTMGGLGVFTQIGYKLYPWAGAPLERTGSMPQLGMRLDPGTEIYQLRWNSWEEAARAAEEMLRASVAFSFLRVPWESQGAILTASNAEFAAGVQGGTLPAAARPENDISWTVMTMAASPAEADYKAKVMNDIITATRGSVVDVSQQEKEILALNMSTACYVQRVFRLGGAMTHVGVMDSFKLLPKTVERSKELMDETSGKDGRNFSGAPDGAWVWPTDGRYMWIENLPIYNSDEPEGRGSALRYFLRMSYSLEQNPIGVNAFIAGSLSDIFGAESMSGANEYMRQIKVHFDPKDIGISKYYISHHSSAETQAMPYGKHVVFSKAGGAILKAITLKMARNPTN